MPYQVQKWISPLAFALVVTSPAYTQDTLSVPLLKRIGEVVDGYRSGGLVYVVMEREYPHGRAIVFETRQAALDAARRGPGLGVFGPYNSPPDLTRDRLFFIGCRHFASAMRERTESYCPDGPNKSIPVNRIREVILTVRLVDGSIVSDTMRADRVDALFFNMSAVDKFAIPYYTKVLGVEYAAGLRAAIVAGFARNQ